MLFTDPYQAKDGLTPEAADRLKNSAAIKPGSVPKDGIIAAPKTDRVITDKSLLEGAKRSYFKITYYSATDGKERVFLFTLLPAIESHLPIQNSGAKVPELKAGICINTKMLHRNIVVPGSTPVVQSIGPESTTMMLTGLFVGNELYDVSNSISQPSFNDELGQNNAFEIAMAFRNEVVLPSIPVFIDIYASAGASFSAIDGARTDRFTRINTRGLIKNIRNCTSRDNRSYYGLDVIVVDYIQRNRVNPETPEEVRAKEQIYDACVLDFERYRKELIQYEEKVSKQFTKPQNTNQSLGIGEDQKVVQTSISPPKPPSTQCIPILKEKNYPNIEILDKATSPVSTPPPQPPTKR